MSGDPARNGTPDRTGAGSSAARAADPRAGRRRALRGLAVLPLVALVPMAVQLRPARAADAGPAAGSGAIAQLRRFLQEARTARGEFTQKTGGGKNRTVQQSRGTFAFQRPGRFRWAYVAPYEQLIVSDGQKVYLYDKDLNQVTVRKVDLALPASPASILFGGTDFEKDFEAAEQGTREGIAWVALKPRATGGTFDRIEIGLRDGLPAAMRLADSFGQLTELAFTRMERNPSLDASLFRFSAPPGADVLEDR